MLKKCLSVLLSLVMLCSIFSIFPISVSAQETDIAEAGSEMDVAVTGGYYDYSTFNERLNACQSDYPNGSYSSWQAPSGWYECWAYANQITDRVFGSYGYTWDYHQDRNSIYPGDLIRYGGYYGTGHTIVVTAVDGDTIYYTDRNGTSNYNMVRWGASINRWDIYFISGDKGRQGIYHAPNWDSVIPWVDPTPQGHVMTESEGAGRTIPDGDYWIGSRIAQDYFVDIPGNDTNTQNGYNVHAWIHDYPLPSEYDVFHFEYLNNGFYRIKQYNTNMCLQVEGSSLYRGANVHMWEEHGSIGAEWSIERSDMGYKIRSRCNNFYMDIDNGKHENGTNIVTWEYHEYHNQYYSLIPYSPNERPLADGIYEIKSSVSNSLYLDALGVASEYKNGTNIDVWNGTSGERFRIKYAGDGWYRIYENSSGLLLEIKNTGTNCLDNGANSMLYESSDSKGQLWKIRKNNDNSYCLINQMSGYYLDLEGSKTENGTNVSQWQYNGDLNQKWKPIRVLQDDMITVSDVVITSEIMTVNPTVTVKVDNTTLKENTNYTVTTTADIPNRKATVTVTGKGNYCGSVTKTIKVTLRPLCDDDVTVNNVTTTSDATSVNPAVTVKVDNKALTKGTDYTVDVSADIPNGTGTVTVTGKGNYSGTVTKTFKITINDTTVVNDFFGNKFETEKGEIITYYANLTSPIQVNYLRGIIYYNQEVLEPILTDDIGYNVPEFENGSIMPMGAGQIRFDAYSSKPVNLNNVMVIRMQFRVIKKGGETWLGHQFETPEFTYENRDNYELEAHILTDQVLYDPSKMILGDANGDGEVDSVDATVVQRAATLLQVPYSEEQLMCADIDGDGSLTIVDATFIQRYDSRIAVPYPVGEAK